MKPTLLLHRLLKWTAEWLMVSVAVFLLYQLMWYMIYDDSSIYFHSPTFILDRVLDFALVGVFCAVSMLFAEAAVRLARHIKTVYFKMLLVSGGLLAFNMLWSYIFIKSLNCLFADDESGFADPVDTYAFGITTTLAISLLFTAKYVRAFVQESNHRLREQEAAKDATIKTLQLQISPHFLFNNLSALTALIDEDKQLANDFVMHLSKFYRHTLQNVASPLIPIDAELNQLEDYLFLLHTRYDTSVSILIIEDYHDDKRLGLMPPGTLQLLVENCIKHNRFSAKDPLKIEIQCDNDKVRVSNSYRPKQNVTNSTHKGQAIIKERFRLLERQEVIIEHDDRQYSVTIPLIQDK